MPETKHVWRNRLLWLVAAVAVIALIYSFRVPANTGVLKPAADRNSPVDFTATDLNGDTWRMIDHRGQVVLLNVFATWCPPCRHETPGLVKLSKKFAGKGVDVVGVSVDEDGPNVVRGFVKQYDIPYPVMMAPPGNSLTASINAIPVTFLIDRRGRIAKHYVGQTEESVFAHDINQLLDEKENS